MCSMLVTNLAFRRRFLDTSTDPMNASQEEMVVFKLAMYAFMSSAPKRTKELQGKQLALACVEQINKARVCLVPGPSPRISRDMD